MNVHPRTCDRRRHWIRMSGFLWARPSWGAGGRGREEARGPGLHLAEDRLLWAQAPTMVSVTSGSICPWCTALPLANSGTRSPGAE